MGLQETRCPEICSLVEGFLRLGGGSENGHWGTELWIDLRQPIGHLDRQPIFLASQNIVVTYKDPRTLIVRVHHPLWQAWIVVAHGPQSGQSLAARTEWWTTFQHTDASHVTQDQLFVLIDANASPGNPDQVVVGPRPFPTSKNTSFLRNFLDS